MSTMSNAKYRMVLVRLGLLASAITAIFWSIWACFAPIPSYGVLQITPDLAYIVNVHRLCDIPMAFLIVNSYGWIFRWLKQATAGHIYEEDFVAGLVVGLGASLAVGLAVGLVVGLAVGLAVGLVVGLAVGLGASLAVGLGAGLGVGLGAGLGVGLGAGLGAGLAAGLGVVFGFATIAIAKDGIFRLVIPIFPHSFWSSMWVKTLNFLMAEGVPEE